MPKPPVFTEMPYEHIPEGFPNPAKDLLKNLSPGKLLQNIKE
jgi:hypothetical protein